MLSDDEPPTHIDLEAVGSTPSQLRQFINEFGAKYGVNISFGWGSNPELHFHFHGGVMTKKEEASTNYIDQSSGPTGAKAFGAHSMATSSGSVTQNQVLEKTQSAELALAFDELISILRDTQLQDRSKLDETIQAISDAKDVAKSDNPQKGAISIAWGKALSWIGPAIAVGAFVAKKAGEIQTIIDRVRQLLT